MQGDPPIGTSFDRPGHPLQAGPSLGASSDRENTLAASLAASVGPGILVLAEVRDVTTAGRLGHEATGETT